MEGKAMCYRVRQTVIEKARKAHIGSIPMTAPEQTTARSGAKVGEVAATAWLRNFLRGVRREKRQEKELEEV